MIECTGTVLGRVRTPSKFSRREKRYQKKKKKNMEEKKPRTSERHRPIFHGSLRKRGDKKGNGKTPGSGRSSIIRGGTGKDRKLRATLEKKKEKNRDHLPASGKKKKSSATIGQLRQRRASNRKKRMDNLGKSREGGAKGQNRKTSLKGGEAAERWKVPPPPIKKLNYASE